MKKCFYFIILNKMWENIREDNTSSTENIKEIPRVTETVKKELESLSMTIFYEKDEKGKNVTYDINAAKNYLTKIKDNFQQCNCVTGIMAVQILLEKQGYDVGKIDGIVGKETRPALKKFQRKHGLTPNGIINKATVQALLEWEKWGGGGWWWNDFDKVIDDLSQRSSEEEREAAKNNITMENVEHIIDWYKQFWRFIDDAILDISDEKIFQKAIERLKQIGISTSCRLNGGEISDTKKEHLKQCANEKIVNWIEVIPNLNDSTLDFIQEWQQLSLCVLEIDPTCSDEDVNIVIHDFQHMKMLLNDDMFQCLRWEEINLTLIDFLDHSYRWKIKYSFNSCCVFYGESAKNYSCLRCNDERLEYNMEEEEEFLQALAERVINAIEAEDFEDYNFWCYSWNLEMTTTSSRRKDTVVCKNAEWKLKSWGVDPKKFLKFINEYIAEAKKQKGNES